MPFRLSRRGLLHGRLKRRKGMRVRFERAKLTQVVGCNDDTVFELDGNDGRSRDDRLLGVCRRAIAVHE